MLKWILKIITHWITIGLMYKQTKPLSSRISYNFESPTAVFQLYHYEVCYVKLTDSNENYLQTYKQQSQPY